MNIVASKIKDVLLGFEELSSNLRTSNSDNINRFLDNISAPKSYFKKLNSEFSKIHSSLLFLYNINSKDENIKHLFVTLSDILNNNNENFTSMFNTLSKNNHIKELDQLEELLFEMNEIVNDYFFREELQQDESIIDLMKNIAM